MQKRNKSLFPSYSSITVNFLNWLHVSILFILVTPFFFVYCFGTLVLYHIYGLISNHTTPYIYCAVRTYNIKAHFKRVSVILSLGYILVLPAVKNDVMAKIWTYYINSRCKYNGYISYLLLYIWNGVCFLCTGSKPS